MGQDGQCLSEQVSRRQTLRTGALRPREGKLVGGFPVMAEKEAGGGGMAEKGWRGWVASIWALTQVGGRDSAYPSPAPELKIPAGRLDRRGSFAPGEGSHQALSL